MVKASTGLGERGGSREAAAKMHMCESTSRSKAGMFWGAR